MNPDLMEPNGGYSVNQQEINALLDGTLVDAHGGNVDELGSGRYWLMEQYKDELENEKAFLERVRKTYRDDPDELREVINSRDFGEGVIQFAEAFIRPGRDWTPTVVWNMFRIFHEDLKDKNAQLKAQLQRCERRLALFQSEAMHDVVGKVTGVTDAIPRRHLRQYFA